MKITNQVEKEHESTWAEGIKAKSGDHPILQQLLQQLQQNKLYSNQIIRMDTPFHKDAKYAPRLLQYYKLC